MVTGGFPRRVASAAGLPTAASPPGAIASVCYFCFCIECVHCLDLPTWHLHGVPLVGVDSRVPRLLTSLSLCTRQVAWRGGSCGTQR